jgi:ATP-binding cassette subfamily F protein 3
MSKETAVLRFDEVTYKYSETKVILDEVDFVVRSGAKLALMGQNGAGKTTLFNLVLGNLKPTAGRIHRTPDDATVGIGRQVIPAEARELTVREWFAGTFAEVPYNLDGRIREVFDAVNFTTDLGKQVKAHSGGQQARMLLAHALIQKPDILLLDEPTNNLDRDGIDHLTGFLMMYDGTVIVISHDAEFLNAFTDGVLYLDVHQRKVEQYQGNYYNVVEEIEKRIERERMQNARSQAEIRRKMDQSNAFAHKGGKLRNVAKNLREEAEELKDSMVEVRREDKTIREFKFPAQKFSYEFNGKILELAQARAVSPATGEVVTKDVDISLRRGMRLLLTGPNGIGKTTFLESVAGGTLPGARIGGEVRVGYYRQDFSTLDFDQTGYEALWSAMLEPEEQKLRSTAAGFLLDGKALATKVRDLSEGQKGLLSFARLVLMEPGLLILDEPTNHINFRHLPVLAEALEAYEGAIVMVSHMPEFIQQVRVDHELDLGKIAAGG